jgi:hypothetical protein
LFSFSRHKHDLSQRQWPQTIVYISLFGNVIFLN